MWLRWLAAIARISQAALSKLQNAVPHPCEPQALSHRPACDVWATTCPKLCCPNCAPPRRGLGCSPLDLPAQALSSPSLGFSFAFGCRPERGETPNPGRCKGRSRVRDIPPLPHAGTELSVEVPRAFASSASQELRFAAPKNPWRACGGSQPLRTGAARSCQQPALRWGCICCRRLVLGQMPGFSMRG